MESITLQDLLERFLDGPNEYRTVDSRCSHGLCLVVDHGQGSHMKSG